ALEDAVHTGKPSFNIVHGTSFFDYLTRDRNWRTTSTGRWRPIRQRTWRTRPSRSIAAKITIVTRKVQRGCTLGAPDRDLGQHSSPALWTPRMLVLL
ncbi:MAG TPA: hypothetical protein VFM54_13175, partial [Micromonosporaceae bacterium]|nr:hypothetical protein [Micromonosporaceae bacterium]